MTASDKIIVPEFKRLVQKAFADVYLMFHKFKVEKIQGLTQIRGQVDFSVFSKLPVIEVTGSGTDFNPKWRYSGGLEEWVVCCR